MVLRTTEVWNLLVMFCFTVIIILFYCNNVGSRINGAIWFHALKSHTASHSVNLLPPSKSVFLDLVQRPIYPAAYLTPPAGCFTGTTVTGTNQPGILFSGVKHLSRSFCQLFQPQTQEPSLPVLFMASPLCNSVIIRSTSDIVWELPLSLCSSLSPSFISVFFSSSIDSFPHEL